MTISKFDGRVWRTTATALPGHPAVLTLAQAGAGTLAVHAAGVGVSAAVDLTLSPTADVAAGLAMWVRAAGLGDTGVVVNDAVIDAIPSSITAVRVTADGGEVAVEIQQ